MPTAVGRTKPPPSTQPLCGGFPPKEWRSLLCTPFDIVTIIIKFMRLWVPQTHKLYRVYLCTLNVCCRDVSLSLDVTNLLNSGIKRYVELALSKRLFNFLPRNNITLYMVVLAFFYYLCVCNYL